MLDRTTGKIIPPPKKEVYFSWSWSRKSWSDAQRNVFIDFGDQRLLWVTEGMGGSTGKGIFVSKEDFIKKYGGDVKLLASVLNSSE